MVPEIGSTTKGRWFKSIPRNQPSPQVKATQVNNLPSAGGLFLFSSGRSKGATVLWSAKMVVVVKRPPSPGDTHDASRQAQTSSQRGNRRAACVCGRWPEHCPGLVPEFQDLTRSAVGPGCSGVPIL